MKPIPTWYKGYYFRSRLEARWAVFFDALNLEWEYEKQGYLLNEVPYLPDFWLPKLGFVEVKADDKDPDYSVLQALADQANCIVMVFRGIPDPSKDPYSYCDEESSWMETIRPVWLTWEADLCCEFMPPERPELSSCKLPRLTKKRFWNKITEFYDKFGGEDSCMGHFWGYNDHLTVLGRDVVLTNAIYISMKEEYDRYEVPNFAFKAARSARFEHGERGSMV